MRASDQALQRAIGGIYDAAIQPALWGGALADLSVVMGAVGAGLVAEDKRAARSTFVSLGRLDNGLLDAFQRRYLTAARNPWTRAMQPLQAGAVVSMVSLLPVERLTRTAYYDEILRPQGILHSLLAVLENDASQCVRVSVMLSDRNGPGEPEQIGTLARVAPHLRRACEVSARLAGASIVQTCAAEAQSRGVFLFDRDGSLIFTNPRAEAMLTAGDGLLRRGGGLSAILPREAEALARALASARAGTAAAVRISRRDGALPYVGIALPTRAEAGWPVPHAPAAMLLVTDLAPSAAPVEHVLVELYGLTPTEARVAAAVAQGEGLPATARQLRIAVATVRTHLAQVFRKTGVRSQAALAGLLARLDDLAGSGGSA